MRANCPIGLVVGGQQLWESSLEYRQGAHAVGLHAA